MVRHDRPGRFQQHELDVFVFARKQRDLLVVNLPARGMLETAFAALSFEDVVQLPETSEIRTAG